MAERVALVSGGARGIGLEVVRGLAADGCRVFLGARDVAAGRAAIDDERVTVVALDVTDDASVAACAAAVRAQAGRLDVLVNNAGIILDRGVGVLDASFDDVRATLDVNLFGAWRLTAAVADLLRAAGPGARIINVSSGMGQLDDMQDGSPGYRVSKLALNGLTRMLHTSLSGGGVSVTSVCPGWVRTDMGGDGAHLSVAEGADTILWLARLAPDELPSGGFYKRRERIPW